MNLFIIEIYCQYTFKKNEYKKIGEIKTSNICYLPIGSHLIISNMEVEVISYLMSTDNVNNNVKMLVKTIDEEDENCYKNKIYRF